MPDINFDFDVHLSDREMARVLDLLADLREGYPDQPAPSDPKPDLRGFDTPAYSDGSYATGWNQALDHAVSKILGNVETLARAYHEGTLEQVIRDEASISRII